MSGSLIFFFSSGLESNYKSLICGSETVALKEQTRCGAGNVALLQREVRMVPDHLLSLILFRYQGERTGIKDRVSAALGIQVQKLKEFSSFRVMKTVSGLAFYLEAASTAL